LKRILRCLLVLMMILTALGANALTALEPDTQIGYNDLSAGHRALFEQEMASALANARSRTPGAAKLMAAVRGDFNGYTGTKSDNSLKAEYRVTDSVVAVGEKVTFYVTMTWDYGRLTYTIGGQMLDTDFDPMGPLVPSGSRSYVYPPDGEEIPEGTKQLPRAFSFTPKQAGYFNYVIILEDGNGNKLALTTPTVQVYDGEAPTFDSIGTDKDIGLDADNSLAMRASLDRTKTKVGEDVTATATFRTMKDPVKYTATWTLTDADGNELDVERTTGEVNATSDNVAVTFPYKPLNGGELQFLVTATDGDGNQVKISSPWLTVEDGFYFTARLNRVSAMMVGDSVKATYNVYGHECDEASYFIGWESYDGEGNTLKTDTALVSDRSGSVSYVPRIGQGLEFYIGATCPHISGAFPARVNIALVGAIDAEVSLTGTSLKSGETIGMNYSITGGLTPFQKIVVNGYSVDTGRNKTHSFLSKTITGTEGTVYGTPYLGDKVYFTLTVVEKDGNTNVWTTEQATMTGAPSTAELKLDASLDRTELALGNTVTLTWKMTGGSATINRNEPESSCILWKNASGTVVKREYVTKANGTAAFTPEEAGRYTCEVTLLDAYNQTISWQSGTITVSSAAALPGDANGDGSVDVADALRIMQYAAGWSVSLNKTNADVNASGGVDLNDAILILRYNAGEDVVLQ